MSFNASTRTLTGTPTALGAYTLTYTVTDTDSRSAMQTFTLNVVDTLVLADPADQTYSTNQAIATFTLPQADGGNAPYTYTLSATTTDGSLTGTLPAGLSFNDSSRQLTGMPTASGTYTMIYTATDSDSRSATQTFTLSVVDALVLDTPAHQTYIRDRAIATFTLAAGHRRQPVLHLHPECHHL